MNIDDQREAVDDASKQFNTLILACLLAAIYFAIALAQLSDADYLTGLGQKLPILDATVPTNAFLILAPALVLVLHLALLVQWKLYRRRVLAFIEDVPPAQREDQLRTLYSFLFLLSLIPEKYAGRTRWLAVALVIFGLVVAPLLLLICVQVRSLSFHDHFLTGFHRFFVLADMVAIWAYFPFRFANKLWRTVAITAGGVSAIALALFIWIDAVVPDQSVKQIPEAGNFTDRWFRERRLYLRGAILEPKRASDSPQARLDLQCRDMRFADMSDATLVRPALYGATLRGARLNQARFVDTELERLLSDSESARRGCAAVKKKSEGEKCAGPRVDFRFVRAPYTQFEGQDLQRADFTGAALVSSTFLGSNLSCARMEGARLDLANLMGTRLHAANLRLASLIRADLSFASLMNADLTAADLRGATLWRNSLANTTLHLVDLSLASSVAPSANQLAQLREVLTLAQKLRPGSAPHWDTIEAFSAPGMERGRDRPLFGIDASRAWFLKYDYLSIPQTALPEPLSGHDFSTLLWAFLDNEARKKEELKDALAAPRSNEQAFLPLSMLRDQLPQIGLPNEAPIDIVRDEMIDADTLWVLTGVGEQKNVEARDLALLAEEIQPSKVAWMEAINAFLLSKGATNEALALRSALWDAANAQDSLAVALLARLFSVEPKLRDDKMIQWLVQQTTPTTSSADAGTLTAVAALMPNGPGRTDVLRRAAPRSARATIELAAQGEEASIEEAAKLWQVEAQYVRGSRVYTDTKASPEAKREAWRHLARAAYRGHTGAQFMVGLLMKEEGDYAGAALWLGRAATSGAPRFENAFAWFLATCPIGSFRDPAKALSLSHDAMRRSKATPFDADDIEAIAPEDALDTLAAAYAASGDFKGAIETQTEALTMMRRGKDKEAIVSAERRLASYKSRTAWIDH